MSGRVSFTSAQIPRPGTSGPIVNSSGAFSSHRPPRAYYDSSLAAAAAAAADGSPSHSHLPLVSGGAAPDDDSDLYDAEPLVRAHPHRGGMGGAAGEYSPPPLSFSSSPSSAAADAAPSSSGSGSHSVWDRVAHTASALGEQITNLVSRIWNYFFPQKISLEEFELAVAKNNFEFFCKIGTEPTFDSLPLKVKKIFHAALLMVMQQRSTGIPSHSNGTATYSLLAIKTCPLDNTERLHGIFQSISKKDEVARDAVIAAVKARMASLPIFKIAAEDAEAMLTMLNPIEPR